MESTALQGVVSSSWTQVLDATKGKHRLDFLKAIEGAYVAPPYQKPSIARTSVAK
jgi:hypothetical protein